MLPAILIPGINMNRIVTAWIPSPAKKLIKHYIGWNTGPVSASRHWVRIVMDKETALFMKTLNPSTIDAVEISGNDKWKNFGFRSYRSLNYPDFDICQSSTEIKYDLLIAEQVLEHVLNPRTALQNMYNCLKPGGILFISTPFLIRIHGYPVDVSRWTELGMKGLLHETGFDVFHLQSWGNRQCVIANLCDEWILYKPRIHSLQNDPRFPVVVWAFARR